MAKKKKAHEMTTEELAKRVFPKKVHENLKKLAGKSEPESSSQDKDKP